MALTRSANGLSRVRLSLMDELFHPPGMAIRFSPVTAGQVVELRLWHRIMPWGTGPPVPKSRRCTDPKIPRTVLMQRQDQLAQTAILPVALHTAACDLAESAGGTPQGAGPYGALKVFKQR